MYTLRALRLAWFFISDKQPREKNRRLKASAERRTSTGSNLIHGPDMNSDALTIGLRRFLAFGETSYMESKQKQIL